MANLMDTVIANPMQTQSWPTLYKHSHGQPTVMANLMDTVMANPIQTQSWPNHSHGRPNGHSHGQPYTNTVMANPQSWPT